MESNLRCKLCQKIFNLISRYPMVYSGTYYCYSCCCRENYEAQPADNMFVTKLKQEVLISDCHPDQEEHSIDLETFKVYCTYCAPPNKCLLDQTSPRSFLYIQLQSALKKKKYPREYIKDLLYRTRPSSSLQEIVTTLKKKVMFDSQYALCSKDLEPTIYLDREKFTFHCPNCITETCHDFNTYKDYFILIAFEKLSVTKTDSFRTYIIDCIRNQNYDKNFFLEMKEVVSNQESNLSNSSFCLICKEPFNVGEMIPIKLHEEDLHEICYKCYKNQPYRNCPIDGKPFPLIPNTPKAKFLFELPSKSCDNDSSHIKFSYFKKNLPFKLSCSHNICSACIIPNAHSLSCINCEIPNDPKNILPNKAFIERLKYIELMCEEHPDQIIKSYIPADLKVLCQKCKPNPKADLNPENFNIELNKKLKEVETRENKLLETFFRDIILHSLHTRLNAYRYITNQERYKRLWIFKQIGPKYFDSKVLWGAKRDYAQLLTITSNCLIEISGIIVGKPVDQQKLLEIRTSDKIYQHQLEPLKADDQDKFVLVPFHEILDANSGLNVSFKFSEGVYCHGLPDKSFKPVDKLDLDPDNFISLSSTTIENGNLLIGGPILGLTVSRFYLSSS